MFITISETKPIGKAYAFACDEFPDVMAAQTREWQPTCLPTHRFLSSND